jgi:hypothetical protein
LAAILGTKENENSFENFLGKEKTQSFLATTSQLVATVKSDWPAKLSVSSPLETPKHVL